MKPAYWLILGAFVLVALGGGAVVTNQLTSGNGASGGGSFPDFVMLFAEAIASAEGFFRSGSRPQRNNNPGDLTLAFGQPTTGKDGSFPIFATVDAGWTALYTQVNEMFFGGSAYYNPSMTIAQVGYTYANGANDPQGAANWAVNVASYLGVTSDTVLSDLMGAQS